MTLAVIVGLLPSLTPAELQQVRLKVGALLSVSGSVPSHGQVIVDSDESWVLGCICDHCRDNGRDLTPVSMLRNAQGIGTFREYLPQLMRYLETGAGKARQRKHILLLTGLDLLAANLERMRIPITSRLLLRNVSRIPAVIDQAFPGYYRNGRLPWVIQIRENGNGVRAE